MNEDTYEEIIELGNGNGNAGYVASRDQQEDRQYEHLQVEKKPNTGPGKKREPHARGCCHMSQLCIWMCITLAILVVLLSAVIGFLWYIYITVSKSTMDLEMVEMTTMPMKAETTMPTTSPTFYRDCKDAQARGHLIDIIEISPDDGPPFSVACNHQMEGGGWTIIQRRDDGACNFSRIWKEYREGFCQLTGNHWLGNEKIHRLTASRDQVLLVVIVAEGLVQTATYNDFRIAGEDDFYRVFSGVFKGGTAGNGFSSNDNQRFTTIDADHDISNHTNCARLYDDGWWYKSCGWSINAVWGPLVIWRARYGRYLRSNGTQMMLRARYT